MLRLPNRTLRTALRPALRPALRGALWDTLRPRVPPSSAYLVLDNRGATTGQTAQLSTGSGDDDHFDSSDNETKSTQNTEDPSTASNTPDELTFPWESGISSSSTGSNDTTTALWPEEGEFRLPWEDETAEPLEKPQEHLILRPLRKKSSPLEKVQQNLMQARQQRLAQRQPQKTAQPSQRSRPGSVHHFSMVDFERDVKNLMVFKIPADSDQLFKDIDRLRPKEQALSPKRYDRLVETLTRGYQVKQLQTYLTHKRATGARQKTKKQLVKSIVSKYWGIKPSADVSEELTTEVRITLQNKREAFLLLSHNGYLVHSWSRLGASLDLSPDLNDLIVRGSSTITNFVQASWNYLLNNVSSAPLKLDELSQFYEESLHRTVPIESLQRLSNVFFDKVSDTDQLYILSSFNQANLYMAKSSLLTATEHSAMSHDSLDQSLVGDSNELVFKEYTDASLPWYMLNDGAVLRLKKPAPRLYQSLLADPVDPAAIAQQVDRLRGEVRVASEKFQYNFIEKTTPTNPEEVDNFPNEEPVPLTTPSRNTHFSDKLDFSRIYTTLTPETPRRTEAWTPRSFNATFGRILFQKRNLNSNYFFHANLPELNRKLSGLALFDKDAQLFGAAGGIRNNFESALQIKMIPDGFANFNNFATLPAVEIWFRLSKGRVDLESCNVFVSEDENNHHVALPEFKTDVMFQSSYNSLLVDENEGLSASKQKHLHRFVNSLPNDLLDLSEPGAINRLISSIDSHTVPVVLDPAKEPVPYLITAINKRRTIELEYNGCPLVYQVVSNGEIDRFEVSLVSETVGEEMTEEKFKRFGEMVGDFLRMTNE